ncbi:MAG: helix-turn-helix transcriptional regulator, partial [Caulobacteraceae bacterium]
MSPGLSARQEECLRLTAFLTDKEIAARLGLSEATIKKHVHEACRRLGVNRRKAALALLERNVPEGTKDPIGEARSSASSPDRVRESEYRDAEQAPSTLDVGRSGSRAGRVQPGRVGEPAEGLSDAGTGGRRAEGVAAGTVAAGPERGLGDGADGSQDRRLGYRPPPRSGGVRILIILVTVVLAAVMMRAIADAVVAYQRQVHVIDVNVMSGGTQRPPE